MRAAEILGGSAAVSPAAQSGRDARAPRFGWLIASILLALSPAPCEAGATSEHWPAVETIDATLRQGRWKPARRQAKRLAATVVKTSWYGAELDKVLAELAFQQAAALANLGKREQALWYWHIAQNLDFRIRRKDLASYGNAGKLLREFPLRAQGEVPARFRVFPRDGNDRAPGLPKIEEQKILTNTGATLDRLGDFAVELVIDAGGKMHQPVVISTQQHPIVLYYVLEAMLDFPPFTPATYDREPVDCLYDLIIRVKVIRW